MRRRTGGQRNLGQFSALLGWSGWAAALSGVSFLVLGYVDRAGAPWYLDLAVLVLGIVVPLLFLVGLVGTYIKCRTQAGWLSLVGFVVSFAGAGWAIIEAVMKAPNLYGRLGERNYTPGLGQECGFCLLTKLSLLLTSPLTLLLVGLSIIGLTTLRQGILKDWGFLLLAMAIFGWVYQLTDDKTGIVDARSIHIAFGFLFGLSWMLLGYTLWSSKNEVS